MYRLCLTSVVLFALGTGASIAQDTSTPAAGPIATIDSVAPTALDSSATADSTANTNAEPSPGVENDAQPARANKRSMRRHATAASTKTAEVAPTTTAESAPTTTGEIEPTKTVEIKDTGERTVCEDVGLPGSRMVVGKRCHTYNIYDRVDAKLAAENTEQTKRTLTELRHMQDNLELEQRQQEWNRERAIAGAVLGTH